MDVAATLISIGISLAVFVLFSAVVEAGRRRGIDPVGDIARFLSPGASDTAEEEMTE